MPKKNKTACKRRKCQRSRSQRRRRNNNRRTRTIRRGGWPWTRTPTLSETLREAARDNSPTANRNQSSCFTRRRSNAVAPQIQQLSYNRELDSVTNSFHEDASAARRSIINNNKEILNLLNDDVLTANTRKDQDIKLQAVRKQEKIIRDLEREDARLRSRAGLPDLPPDMIPDAALGMKRLSGRVGDYNAAAADAHQRATFALNDQTNILDGKMSALNKELADIGE